MKKQSVFAIALLIGILLNTFVKANTYIVNNTNDSGPGSLRQAILDANDHAGADDIVFQILDTDSGYDADLGVWIIRPETNLPTLLDGGTFIDGSSQEESQGDRNLLGPDIVLDGTDTEDYNVIGITIASSDNVIQGLIIVGFEDGGIELQFEQSVNNHILCNYIGIDGTGDSAKGNGKGISFLLNPSENIIGGLESHEGNVISGNINSGVVIGSSDKNVVIGNIIGLDAEGNSVIANGNKGITIYDGSHGNRIGGDTEAERNIISGNIRGGISIYGEETRENVVKGNYIGTDQSGTQSRRNESYGISLSINTKANTIGGLLAGECNVISCNKTYGVYISDSDSNIVQGNAIGTDMGHVVDLGNGWSGVQVTADAQYNQIGSGNTIEHNGGSGVEVYGSGTLYNRITQNSIFNNGSKGIQLGDGGNGDFTCPVITSAGSVSGTASPNSTVEIFSDSEDEGEIYEATVLADGSGNFTWSETPGGPFVTATATDVEGNTSEFSVPGTSPGLAQDSLALVALYNSTDGSNWTDNSNWLSGPVSTWYGIAVSGGRVLEIDLENNNLSGPLPVEIGDLTALRELDMCYNKITDTIPSEIGNLTDLELLYLYSNELTGRIPASIELLTNLGFLDLSNNQLTDSLPSSIGNLVSLYRLELADNQLSGNLPETIWDLTNLYALNLSDNQFTGSISSGIGYLTDMTYMYMFENQFSGPLPPEIGALSKINNLDLTHNQFEGAIPSEIGNLTKLKTLYLGHNQFVDSLPPEIGDLVDLTYLSVYHNQLSGSIPEEIGNLIKLSTLYLHENQFSGAIPAALGDLSNLMRLNIGVNQLTGAVPGAFTNLNKLVNLQVDRNQLDELPDLSSLPDLNHLYVNENRFTFEDLEPNVGISDFLYAPQDSVGEAMDTTVAYGESLSFSVSVGGANNQYQWYKDDLMIPGAASDTHAMAYVIHADEGSYICHVSNTVATELTLFSHRIHVNVTGIDPEFEQDSLALVALYESTNGAGWIDNENWLTGSVETWHGITISSNRVYQIALMDNNLTGTIPPEIGDLSSLRTLNISDNLLTSPIPAEIGSLTSLTHLDIRNNLFNGSIPEEIGNLANLQQCYLDDNQFSGSIPAEMGNLIKVTYIDLTDNQLSGAVPDEFTNLVELKTLRINYNQLDGLPHLSLLPELQTVYAQSNRFTFEDIEPNISIPNFYYWPQDSVGEAQDTIIAQGSSLSLTVDIGGANNQYQWLHDQTIIPEGTSDTYTIDSATITDEGSYVCRIANSVATELILYNRPITVTVSVPEGLEQDSLALVALYDSTDGSNWTNNENWITGPLNTWYGITVEDGRVKIVNLDNNHLVGVIPPEIGNLTAVTYLYLKENELSGFIPPEIGNLTLCERLHLTSNQLEGEIPPEIGNLASVESLYMGNNQFTGSIPPEIGNLSNLSDFYLYGSQLTGPIPPEIGNCTNLGGLYLYDNQLSDSIPPEICDLTKLSFLSLYGNQLTGGIPPEIGNLTELRRLKLSNNQLSGSIPSQIGDLVKLVQLDLFYNQFIGPVPEEISQCTKLQYLYIHQNQLEGSIPSQFTNLTMLERLYINSNRFTDLPDLSSITTLTDLTAEDNRLTFEDIESNIGIPNFSYTPQDSAGEEQEVFGWVGTSLMLSVTVGGVNNRYQWFHEGIEISEAVPEDSHIILSVAYSDSGTYHCKITNTIATDLTLVSRLIHVSVDSSSGMEQDSLALVALYNSTDGPNWTDNTNWLSGPVSTWFGVTVEDDRVTEVSMRNNQMEGILPTSIGNLSDVKVLDLSYNAIAGTIPLTVGNLSAIENLKLSENQFDGSIPEEIGMLSNLKMLQLYTNALTGEIPDVVWDMTSLTHLYLSENELTGSLPPEIENLINLRWLVIYKNEFYGPIPDEIGNCTQLDHCYLRHNNFTEAIPASIGNCTRLRELFLQGNDFTGTIPSSLGNLLSCNRMSLSDNQLTGTIPPEIGNCTSLWELGLGDNHLEGIIPSEIGNLDELYTLYLNNNQLEGTIPPEIFNSPTLRSLHLNGNQLEGEIPEEIGNCTILERIYLNENQFTGAVPAGLTNAVNLYDIYLFQNQFTDLPDFSSLSSLDDLIVYENRFTFEDIEPNIGITDFQYVPQDSVGEEQDTTVLPGSTLILSIDVGGTANQYQWLKDREEISDADSLAYVIESVALSDSGTYTCQITNTIVTDLTLYSRPINVHVSSGVGVSDRHGAIPGKFALHQNYPNPFNPETKIEYQLPQPSEVKLMIYDVKGQVVRKLVQGNKPAGYHHVVWDSRNSQGQKVATGIYIYKIEMRSRGAERKSFMDVKKMVLMK